MKKTFTTLALSTITLLAASQAYALTITGMDSSGNLAQSLVGSGITISNVQYKGASTASGYFTNGTESGIGIESGIVLTTGSALSLNGITNKAGNTTTVNHVSGDAILNNLIYNSSAPNLGR